MNILANIELSGVNWTAVGVLLGVVGAFITAIFKFGGISSRLGIVESDVKDIKNDIKELRKDLTSRIDEILNFQARKGLADSNSPMTLSPKGKKVLKDSGINDVVEAKYEDILKKVKALKPKNPYQAEQAVLGVVAEFENDPALKDAIEEGAFNSGYLKGSVLFVGGLYVRDRILKELNFKVDDIDKHSPESNQD